MSLILSGTDGLSDVDGSASTPAIRGTDANTGIFFPAADTIAFSEGGTEVVRIDSSGNVGIGTTTPTGKFEVKSANNTGTDSIIRATSNNGTASTWLTFNGVSVSSGNDCVFHVNTTEQARITSTGDFRFNSGYGSSAVAYGCRAWVNFNGSGTPAIRASGNVTSITDNGTGDYTVNFTSAMPDINYSSVGSCSPDSAPTQAVVIMDFSANSNSVVAPTTSALRLSTTVIGAAKDATYISIAIFR
jgi:hypothetical protein